MATDIKNDSNLSTNLVSVWDLGEASGTRVDSHTSGNDLADNNTVGQATGPDSDNCADFVQSNGEYLSIQDSSITGLNAGSSFSMACWINFTTLLGGDAIATKWKWTTGERAYFWHMNTNTSIRLRTSSSGGGGGAISDKAVSWSPSTATWYHIGVSHNSSGQVKFYINGSQQGATQTGGNTTVKSNGAADFRIGAEDGGSGYLDAKMRQMCFWEKELNSTGFSDLYNSGSLLPYEASGGGSEPVFIPKFTCV